MSIVSYIVSIILMAVTIGFVVLAVRKLIRNNRGWKKMEADREAQGKPFYGELEEELEKDKYGIED